MLGIRKDIRRRTPSKAEQNRKGKTNQNCKSKAEEKHKNRVPRCGTLFRQVTIYLITFSQPER